MDTGKAENADTGRKPGGPLRRGWTTGACATAATKAALTALLTGDFPDPVSITLPKGETPAFALAREETGDGYAEAGIVKDAGDDPDVTHGATIIARVARAAPGTGIGFRAGDGVGTVTRPGLPIPPGEPAINPVPRAMMVKEVEALCAEHGVAPDIEITVSVPGGDALARETWNPRLGILGGISILGTTGVVHPFSCSAWIHSIHRGIDVARAAGLTHVLGATGSTSEAAAQAIHHLPEIALLDMGDFAGGLLKYLRAHPVEKLTIAGGFAKMVKLAQGALDLHSGRSQVDMEFLLKQALAAGLNAELSERILSANTAQEVLELTRQNGVTLAPPIAGLARTTAKATLRDAPVAVEVIVTDRKGEILREDGFRVTETVLILGGTREAAELAAELVREHPHWRVITSLAGRTREPKPVAGEVRIGGFGGAEALAAWLRDEGVTQLIDATHPFARQISRNAEQAAQVAGIPLDIRTREAWRKKPGDDWTEVVSLEAARDAIPSGARVLLALGSQHIARFSTRADVHFLVRMVDLPETPLPLPDCEIIAGLPGATAGEEAALLRAHRITHVVCRNSGGVGAYAKIEAARTLGLPVIMIGR